MSHDSDHSAPSSETSTLDAVLGAAVPFVAACLLIAFIILVNNWV